MAYQESLCTVESVNLGIDNMFNCRCTNYCRALAPCVHIFVDLQAVGESRLAHESLTSLEQVCFFVMSRVHLGGSECYPSAVFTVLDR